MYGHTPPAVIWVDPERVSTVAGMQETAAHIAKMLEKRTVHVVVSASRAWREAPEGAREMALESLRLEPGLVDVSDPDAEMGRILAEHLERMGWPLPHGRFGSEGVEHAPASRVWTGSVEDAAALAREAGASEVVAWTRSDVPGHVDGVTFVRGPAGAT